MDTGFGLAKALAAFCVSVAVNGNWIAWGSPEHHEAIAFARSALADAPDDPSALRLAGWAVAYLAHDREAGQAALDRAIALNPNSAQILGSSGWVRLYLGDFSVARDHFTRAMRLSPLDPELYIFETGLSYALVLGEPADPALGFDLARKSLVARPNWPPAIGALSHCLVRLGRLDEAKETQRQYLAANPNFTLSAYRRRSPFCTHVTDTIIDLHRQAGVPE